eukprot:Em0017g663a
MASYNEQDDGGLVATSSSADDTANAEARDEVNEIEDSEDHLGEWEAFDAGDNDGQPEIDNDGIDSELRSVTCGVFKMEFSLLPDLEVTTGSHNKEGKEEMATQKYMQEWKKAGTAQVLRLTEPGHGSGRVINADSAFAASQRLKPVESMVYISLA